MKGCALIKNINIEVKAKISDHTKVRTILRDMGAVFQGIDHQIDTYYQTKRGRLKVRKGDIENCIVWYNRPDDAEPKQCDYRIMSFAEGSGEALELAELLGEALYVVVIVEKYREIYFIENIKIHLDKVNGIGKFLEIEAISVNGMTVDGLNNQCNELLAHFEIPKSNLIERSYADLVLENSVNETS